MPKKPKYKKSIAPPEPAPVKKPFTTRPQSAIYAVDYYDDAPLKAHADAYKQAAPNDDYILEALIGVYEKSLASLELEGPEHAVHFFWQAVKEYASNKQLTDAELKILYKAKEGNLCAIQTLVKANSRMLRLPFVQDAMIALLKEQKYSTEKNGPTIKDRWTGFLCTRPKGKIMYAEDDIAFLVEVASDNINTKIICDADAALTPHEAVAKELKISVDKVKKMTARKGAMGRPKKE